MKTGKSKTSVTRILLAVLLCAVLALSGCDELLAELEAMEAEESQATLVENSASNSQGNSSNASNSSNSSKTESRTSSETQKDETSTAESSKTESSSAQNESSSDTSEQSSNKESTESSTSDNGKKTSTGKVTSTDPWAGETITVEGYSITTLPDFEGDYYAEINGNVPFFTEEEIAEAKKGAYEYYSPLDELGRCGYAMASLGTELMPTGERGEIYWIHPTGWQKNSGYERSHLIAFQLAGENDNEQNLVTGTHFMNNDGMRPFEEMVGDYVRETDTLVLYRVTPIFRADELVCRGVLMEAMSLHDDGDDILFNIFVFNVFDPSEKTAINYKTGVTYATTDAEGGETSFPEGAATDYYIVNTRSGYFHYSNCDGASSMSEKNRLVFYGTREEAIEAGYTPCPNCNP